MRDHACSILLFIINLNCDQLLVEQIKLWCTRRDSGGTTPLILDLAIGRSLSGQLHATEGWVDTIARLDVSENIQICSAYQESNPDRPSGR
jgi:hypothetical protein